MLTSWHVLVPVRGGLSPKSRLAAAIPRPADRFELAIAFAADVVAAAFESRASGVSVVTADPDVAQRLAAAGAGIIAEPGSVGLDGAVEFGAAQLRRSHPASGLAVLMGNVPEATATAIDEALEAASEVALGVAADHDGTGTALLTAGADRLPHPSYGEGSYARHVALGHSPLRVPETSPLRRDVDAQSDLARLLRGAAGPYTSAALARLAADRGLDIAGDGRLP